MGNDKHEPTVREAVGIFHSTDALRGAIADLLSFGFKPDELGLLASEQIVESSLGDFYKRMNENTGSPDAPAIAFVRRESFGEAARTHSGGLFFVGTSGAAGAIVASGAIFGGALVAALGAVAGVGLVGLFVAAFIHQSDAEYLQQQVDEGQILLFVRVEDEREHDALRLLKQHTGLDVKVYEVPLKSFMPNSPDALERASHASRANP